MLGAEISARFALPPNSRSYCGKPSFRRAFAAFLADKSAANRMALERELGEFTAHYAYLRLIARASKLEPFDAKVAHALWLGNPILSKVKKGAVQKLIARGFCGKGMLPGKKAAALASKMPDGFVPHHSFHVLYLHTISGAIEPSVKNADCCRVSWGKVMHASKGAVEVRTQRLERKDGRLLLLPCRKRWKTSCAGINLVPGAKAGDWVASHWGIAVMKLPSSQARALEKYTLRNVSAANRA